MTKYKNQSLIYLAFLLSVTLFFMLPAVAQDSEANKNESQRVLVPPADYFSQQQDDIKHYLNQVTETLIGTQSHALLEQKSNTPINKGTVLLLPDWHDFIAPAQHLAYLAKTLPDMGYTTISIQPPAMPENYPSTAITEEERATQNKALLDDYLRQLQALMVNVMEKAQQQQGAILVATAGSNAGFLMSLYQEAAIPVPQAFIMLSAYQLTDQQDLAFAKAVSESELPTLDLYLKHDNMRVEPSVKMRQKESTRNLKVEYRQYKLNNFATGYYPQENTRKAIEGWLASMGW
ncbi:DUF3530 family protein [Thalassotalea eurytherma]|uniref:DUF3530 family protein n=1 Tax=Thalassotalea eurytherma TaxID=1144278 RepID=A0ABQ6H8R6_9GAMM|nr:DUF3530 family protein [Thalassotalea eurytherma]GLX82851.1 hypothetical protein theurythT_23030 [Thalassotalea eurytherma]